MEGVRNLFPTLPVLAASNRQCDGYESNECNSYEGIERREWP